MDKLRVGIVINPDNIPTNGGGYSYCQALIKGINEYEFNKSIEIINLVFYKKEIPKVQFNYPYLLIKSSLVFKIKNSVSKSAPRFLISLLIHNPTLRYVYDILKKNKYKKIENVLKVNKVDILYYLEPEGIFFDYPFIATHWDVGHRSMLPFPEVVMNGSYEYKERYYNYTLNKAHTILCESEAGKNELEQYFTFYPKKIKVLPIFAGDIIKLDIAKNDQQTILDRYNLNSEKFFVYPAQFWTHKNHYNLVIAFNKVLQEGLSDIKLVLCGSDKGNMPYIKELIEALNLSENIIVTGFVLEAELFTFYKNAIALIMPTFLGPTNMPLIEAAHLKCPVLCSDLEGHREIMGKHALYFNPDNAEEMTLAMKQVIELEDTTAWVEAANEHIVKSKFYLCKSLPLLNDALVDIIPVRKAWGIR